MTSASTTWSSSSTSSTSTPRPTGPTPTSGRCCSIYPERGRYLGLVLFSAQQFRSQVQRRVVGNAGTALFGRMDMDELATAGLRHDVARPPRSSSPRCPRASCMVRHPHFTQPIFVRFPRPPVLAGREGVERFPPAVELPFADAVARQLRGLDRRVTRRRGPGADRRPAGGRRPPALDATRRERPDDVLAFFTACLGRRVNGEVVAPRRAVPAGATAATTATVSESGGTGATRRTPCLIPRTARHFGGEARPYRRPASRHPAVPPADPRRHQSARGRRRARLPPGGRWRDRGAPGRGGRRRRPVPLRPPDQRRHRLRVPPVPAAPGGAAGGAPSC